MYFKATLRRFIPAPVISAYHRSRCLAGMAISHIRYAVRGIETTDPKEIPIIINNFNRVSCLKKLIRSLEKRGYRNIYIIDNASTFPPLLEYYEECPYKVFRLEKNIGYLSIWESGIYDIFKRSYYVYTDSDMEIDENCPDDFMAKFVDILKRFPMAQKAGFGIRTDNLPSHFKDRDEVIEHEARFWENEVEKNIYEAEIDTTFALYRPFCKGKADRHQKTYRTGKPYVIRHLPWYVDSEKMTEEEEYYIKSITQSTHWSQQAQK